MNQNDTGKKKFCCVNCLNSELEKVQCEKDLFVDRCPLCGGLWFDSGELLTLLKIGDFYIKNLDIIKGSPPVMKQGERHCPSCQSPLTLMINNKAPDVRIDRCTDCKGVWLDRGELYKLAEIYKKIT